MRSSVQRSLFIAIGVLLLLVPCGKADETPPTLEPMAHFVVIHPEALAVRINRLFDGTRVPHPAAALSAWKRATQGNGHLGKPLEALIAMFNPEMVHEWRSFDGSELTVWSTPGADDSRVLDWSIVVPRDDGSVAAALTAGRLTGGGLDEESISPNRVPVERLGPPGAPLAARIGRKHVIAGSRRSLKRVLDELATNEKTTQTTEVSTTDRPITAASMERPGIRFKIDGRLFAFLPSRIRVSRVLADLGQAAEGRGVEGFATLEGDTARIRLQSSGRCPGASPLFHTPPIENEWLGWIPRSQAIAAAVVRFDATPSTWDSLFTLIDRIEKTDPAKAGMMPFRTRFNVLLSAARVQPEIDLWPHLRGTTATILGDTRRSGAVFGVLVALHLDEESSARKVCEVLAPRIADTYLRKSGDASKKSAVVPEGPDGEAGVRPLGEIRKRPVLVARRGRTVLLGWGGGDVFASSLKLGPGLGEAILPAQTGSADSSRLMLIWPGRLGLRIPGIVPDSATGRVLADSAPIVWTGDSNAEMTKIDDTIIWRGLHRLVKDFLETLPLDVLDRR